jgi:transcriptional regulator with XRE-family HTH domain
MGLTVNPLPAINSITMNVTQCRMARTGLGLSAADLASLAGVGYATVARFETGAAVADDTRYKIAGALVKAGALLPAPRSGRVSVSVPE